MGRYPTAHTRSRCYQRSEEHTSELQSHVNLVCRLLLEKKKNIMAEDVKHMLPPGNTPNTAVVSTRARRAPRAGRLLELWADGCDFCRLCAFFFLINGPPPKPPLFLPDPLPI